MTRSQTDLKSRSITEVGLTEQPKRPRTNSSKSSNTTPVSSTPSSTRNENNDWGKAVEQEEDDIQQIIVQETSISVAKTQPIDIKTEGLPLAFGDGKFRLFESFEKGDQPQERAFKYSEPSNGYVFKITDSKYVACPSVRMFAEYLLRTAPRERFFYEMVQGAHKMYADIDGECNLTVEEVMDDAILLIKAAFEEFKLPAFDLSKLRPTESCKPGKLSLHFTYNDPDIAFEDMKSGCENKNQYWFWNYVAGQLEKTFGDKYIYSYEQERKNPTDTPVMEIRNILDLGVYTKHRPMRPCLAAKFSNPDRYLKPFKYDPSQPKGQRISYVDPDSLTTDQLLEYFVSFDQSQKIKKFTKLKQIEPELKPRKQYKDADIFDMILKHVPNVTISHRQKNLVVLKTVPPRKCMLGGEENLTDNCFVVIKRSGLYFGCNDAGCAGKHKKIVDFGQPDINNPLIQLDKEDASKMIPVFGDDKGHASKFAELCQGVYIWQDPKSDGCIWNEEKRIYERVTEDVIMKHVQQVLENHYTNILQKCGYDMPIRWDASVPGFYVRKQSAISSIYRCLRGMLTNQQAWLKMDVGEPHELPIKGGKVFNLKTCTYRDRTMADFYSFECPVEFLGRDHELSNAKRFMNDVTLNHIPKEQIDKSKGPNQELFDYMQKFCGLCLTGTFERFFHIWYGIGRNLKGSLLKVLIAILGPWAHGMDPSIALADRCNDRHKARPKPEYFPVSKARLAYYDEPDDGDRFNEGELKKITGQTSITVRMPYSGEMVELAFSCKIVLATNYETDFNPKIQAVIDRMRCVGFKGRYIEKEKYDALDESERGSNVRIQDKEFGDKVCKEYLSEMFTFFALGAEQYYKENALDTVAAVRRSTANMVSSKCKVSQFLEEKYDKVADDKQRVKRSDFHAEYKQYCGGKLDVVVGEIPKILETLGVSCIKSGEFYYVGLVAKSVATTVVAKIN